MKFRIYGESWKHRPMSEFPTHDKLGIPIIGYHADGRPIREISGGAGAGDFVFNSAKGFFAQWVANVQAATGTSAPTIGGANDALILVPVTTASVIQAGATDAVVKRLSTLSAVLGGTTVSWTEQIPTTTPSSGTPNTTNRKQISASVTVLIVQNSDWVDVDTPDQVWQSMTGPAVGKLIFAYDTDTTPGAGTDANVMPISAHSWDATPDGTDVTATIAGFARAT